MFDHAYRRLASALLAPAAITTVMTAASCASPDDAPRAPTEAAAPAPAEPTPPATGKHDLVEGELDTILRVRDLPFDEPLRVAVKDALAWRALWARLHAGQEPAPACPVVDFTKDMVLVASSGRKPTAGFAVTIRGSSVKEGALVVGVEVRPPREGAIVAQVRSHPAHIVRHARHEGPVLFEDRAPPPVKRR